MSDFAVFLSTAVWLAGIPGAMLSTHGKEHVKNRHPVKWAYFVIGWPLVVIAKLVQCGCDLDIASQ